MLYGTSSEVACSVHTITRYPTAACNTLQSIDTVSLSTPLPLPHTHTYANMAPIYTPMPAHEKMLLLPVLEKVQVLG